MHISPKHQLCMFVYLFIYKKKELDSVYYEKCIKSDEDVAPVCFNHSRRPLAYIMIVIHNLDQMIVQYERATVSCSQT